MEYVGRTTCQQMWRCSKILLHPLHIFVTHPRSQDRKYMEVLRNYILHHLSPPGFIALQTSQATDQRIWWCWACDYPTGKAPISEPILTRSGQPTARHNTFRASAGPSSNISNHNSRKVRHTPPHFGSYMVYPCIPSKSVS